MAISDQQIFDWFLANPGADDATIASTMNQFGLKPEDISRATGADLSNVQSRYEAVSAPPVSTPSVEAPTVTAPATLSDTPTLAELQAMYEQQGATQARENYTEQGTTVDYIPVQYGGGWSAWEKAPVQIGTQGDGMDAQPIFDDKKELGGFTKQEGDWVTTYDLNGNIVDRHKWNENMLKSTIKDLGPLVLAALTAGGGAGMTSLGNTLFGLEGAAAAGAGGALAGGVNAWGNDQNILKGALLGGVSGAGAQEIGKIGDTSVKLNDVTKAINFAQNPTLAGAANIVSPYVPNVSVGDGAVSLNDVLKGVTTAQALGSGDYKQIFDAITGVAKGTNTTGLTSAEQDQIAQNRETSRLNRIEDAVLNQPASDDGSTAGIVDLINEMYPGANVAGMSQGDLAKFLEANTGDTQGSAELETLLKGQGQTTADEGTVTVTGDRPTGLGDFMVPTSNIGEQEEMVITGNKNGTSLKDLITLNDIAGDTSNNYADDTVFVTDKKDSDYIPSLRTKEIKSDIPDEITPDQIDKLFPDLNINDILQVIPKTVTPTTVTPKTTVPSTTTAEQALANLGLNAPMPSQDPYANIKLMEELFGGDTAYKLRALGAPKNQASTDIDALARLLRKQNV
jgi:hypothetical protein